MTTQNTLDPIIRKQAVLKAVPLSYATIQRKIKAGEFPAPVRLGANSVGWKLSEVQAWLDSLETVGEVA